MLSENNPYGIGDKDHQVGAFTDNYLTPWDRSHERFAHTILGVTYRYLKQWKLLKSTGMSGVVNICQILIIVMKTKRASASEIRTKDQQKKKGIRQMTKIESTVDEK